MQAQRIKCQISSITNVAVDRVLTQIARSENSTVKIARVGALEKVDKSLLDYFVGASESKKGMMLEFERVMKRDQDPRLQELARAFNSDENFLDKQKTRLKDADVIGVTCASALSTLLADLQSQVLILDEVSQVTEALCLLPIASARPLKLIMVGDPRQLPPALSVPSTHSETSSGVRFGDFSRTLFSRLLDMGLPSKSLRIQYRCHPDIANICSNLFYDGSLKHGISAASRAPVIESLPTFVAVNNIGEDARSKESCINKSEIELVYQILTCLQNSFGPDLAPPSIGIICMYKAQAYEINEKVTTSSLCSSQNIYISTVDAFQGNEMDIVIICTTRNTASEFISNPNRINVAISRARNHLILIGNLESLRQSELWCKVLSFPHSYIQDIKAFERIVSTSPSVSTAVNPSLSDEYNESCQLDYGMEVAVALERAEAHAEENRAMDSVGDTVLCESKENQVGGRPYVTNETSQNFKDKTCDDVVNTTIDCAKDVVVSSLMSDQNSAIIMKLPMSPEVTHGTTGWNVRHSKIMMDGNENSFEGECDTQPLTKRLKIRSID